MFSPRGVFDPDFEFLADNRKSVSKPGRNKPVEKIPTFNLLGSPPNTLVKYNCFISFSNLLGKPGYMLLPPLSTICL